MVMDVITERVTKRKSKTHTPGTSAEDVLLLLSREELLSFVIGITKHNPELASQVMQEFAHKIETSNNKYTALLREAFDRFEFYDEDDYYDSEDWMNIDFLDDWLEKADNYLADTHYAEAVLIAKAGIEELSRWMREKRIDAEFDNYEEHIFSILKEAACGGIDKKELYNYCLEEVQKAKYQRPMGNYFHDFMLTLAPEVDPQGFLSFQDKLLADEDDKTSWNAQKILTRKINLYRAINEPSAAWNIVKDNLQIKDFRKEWVEHLIEEKNFSKAKKLLHEVVEEDSSAQWDKLLLSIAREEKDRSEIRRLAFKFIKDYFYDEYYRIYKAAFNQKEWPAEKERLIGIYGNKKLSGESLTGFYNAEGDMPELLACLKKTLNLNQINKYYKALAAVFPEKTLSLFRKSVDNYARNHTGRGYYEEIVGLLIKIAALPGGEKAVQEMIGAYRLQYKNRRAMMEILTRNFGPAKPVR